MRANDRLAMAGIRVEFFASLREALGVEAIEIPDEQARALATVQDVRDWVGASIDSARTSELAAKRTRCAVNDEFVALGHAVRAGDRVAFMPAVTGG